MNIDSYYSDVPLEVWKKVLDENMHYHFGISYQDEDPFEYAVKILYKFISPNSAVLDCGCGWGAPAKMLIRDLNCHVDGVTNSKQQYEYIKDFKVYYKDLHNFIPEQKYDTAFFLESYTHLYNPIKIIKNFYSNVEAVLIKDYSTDVCFESPEWNMILRNKKQYYKELSEANYKITYYKEYNNVVYPSSEYWYKKIKNLPKHEIKGQIKCLYELCKKAILLKYEKNNLRGVIIHAVKNK